MRHVYSTIWCEKCTAVKMSEKGMILFVASNMSGSEKRKLIVIVNQETTVVSKMLRHYL